MKMNKVSDSSAIAAHGYDPGNQKMRVQFVNGGTYEYEGISPEKYAAFTGAKSMGSFHHRKIRPYHEGVKVADGKAEE